MDDTRKFPIIEANGIHRVPFLAIDSLWRVKWKWLWDDFACENGGYTGYLDAWNYIPWQIVELKGIGAQDWNFAAPAQYMPVYDGLTDNEEIFERCVKFGYPENFCINCLGLVQDMIDLLEADGIADAPIPVSYPLSKRQQSSVQSLRDILFKDFNRNNSVYPIVFSRPMTFIYGGAGHIGDNAQKMFFCRAKDSTDGSVGEINPGGEWQFRDEFRADSMWFLRKIPAASIPNAPRNAKLALYIISCGSVARIRINDEWFHVSSLDNFPPYGDPYGFSFRGYKAVIEDYILNREVDGQNSIAVEHISPVIDSVGAQVIFAFEW